MNKLEIFKNIRGDILSIELNGAVLDKHHVSLSIPIFKEMDKEFLKKYPAMAGSNNEVTLEIILEPGNTRIIIND